MEVSVGKKVEKISRPHQRFKAYLEIAEEISQALKTTPRSGYLMVTAERDGFPEEIYLGDKSFEEIKKCVEKAKITWIEPSIPGTFTVKGKVWRFNESSLAPLTNEVCLVTENLSNEELRELKSHIENLKGYFIEFGGKRWSSLAT
jgi:hypothetical protein